MVRFNLYQHRKWCTDSFLFRRDLFAYRTLLWTYEKLFDVGQPFEKPSRNQSDPVAGAFAQQLPISFVSEYVTEQMRKEVDLHNEALNATKTAQYLANEPSLRDKVSRTPSYYLNS